MTLKGEEEENPAGTICWKGFRIFPFPEPTERQYVYLLRLFVSGHKAENKKAPDTSCRDYNGPCFYWSCFVFHFYANIWDSWQGTFTAFQSHCCVCCSLSVHAPDLYFSGSASSDLGSDIQSQETQAIPVLCSSLASVQWHLVLCGLGSVQGGSLLPIMEVHQRMSHNGKHKAPLTSIYDACFRCWIQGAAREQAWLSTVEAWGKMSCAEWKKTITAHSSSKRMK